MNVTLSASHTSDNNGLPTFSLTDDDSGLHLCHLDIEFKKLRALGAFKPITFDLLLLAGAVYAMDKLSSRAISTDCWTRKFRLTIEVMNPVLWRSAKSELIETLKFLSGDTWDIRFRNLEFELTASSGQNASRRVRTHEEDIENCNVACLFSGGLDSLIGAINYLEQNRSKRILLIGHHDGKMGGPFHDQRQLYSVLSDVYSPRVSNIFIRAGHTNRSKEITLRSRSFLFLSIGIFAANALDAETPLLIPENGTIALNVPLSPSRRGSCSTRTAHPHYLHSFHRVLEKLGISNKIINTLANKTKGESVSTCQNLSLLRRLSALSRSCAKSGHRVNFTRRSARECGRCMPCIYRRAALHTIGADNEVYGDDICIGEVDIFDTKKKKPNDLRACLSFLKRRATHAEVQRMLISNGHINLDDLSKSGNLVLRAMNEIRKLIRDKGTSSVIRNAAGIS